MSAKTSPSFVSLAVGAFAIGLAEFLIMGLLPEVAHSMNVTIAQAGHFISAYALGVVVGAPLLTIIGRSMPPKKQLLFLMSIFTIFNALSAIAPNSTTLLILRFLSGLPHGAYFGVGGVVAGRLAGPGKAASAFALVISGLTICNVIGVPVATSVGHATNWRVAFGLISLVGLLTIIAISFAIPRIEGEPKRGLGHEFVIFKNPMLWYLIAFGSIGFGGFFAWYSYITPILTQVAQIPLHRVPYLLALAGLGMTAGNWLGGKIADRTPPIKVMTYASFSMVLVLSLDALFVNNIPAMYVLTFLTAANAMGIVAPVQMLLIEAAKESPFLGSSIGQSAFNMGNSIGALFGGLPLAAGYGLTSPWWTGAALAAIGIIIVLRLRAVAPKEYQGLPTHGAQALH